MINKIDKNELLGILNDWNFWQKDLEIGKLRKEYLEKINKLLKTNQILVITGARRSGKSFIMRQLAKQLLNKAVPSNQILMINFEDPRFPKLAAKDLQYIYEVYLEVLNPKDIPYVFLDEVQEVEEWEKWARTIHELKKAQVIISGSNAKLLSREFATLLTGRHADITVFPLSFKEFLFFKEISVKNKLDLINQRVEIKRLLNEYIQFGSFPEAIIAEEKQEILLRYFDDIVNKDLIKRYKIRKSQSLKSLAKFYLSNPSSLITFHSLSKFLNLSAETIEKFSDYLNTAYLVFFLKRFSFTVKEQEKSPRKSYAIDSGLANIVGFKFSEDRGKLIENLVFLELSRRQQSNPYLEVYYWKDERHKEVDFVLKEKMAVSQLIQVCKELNNEKTRDREIKPLLKAMSEFNLKQGLIITEDEKREEEIQGKTIIFTPLWEWLLEAGFEKEEI